MGFPRLCVLWLLLWLTPLGASVSDSTFDWRSEWVVEPGFAVFIDTEGYHLPSSIAFVPDPGPGPKDPLYFVTELRGKVKVVTNDRTVYTFAEDFFQFAPERELPAPEGQGGLAGICLEPENGYVFVTFIYQDENYVVRNNLVRFKTRPGTFDIKPSEQVEFTDVFEPYDSGLAHQIGPCQIKDGLLYVSVGDGWQPAQSQQVNSLLGKIIRMTFDGDPVPENPFYQDADRQKARNYVWAYGLRNPYSFKIVGDRFFVADNGHEIDRFLEVHGGENYLWDGHDWSIATNASFVFVPSACPTQLDFYPSGSEIFPATYEDNFFLGVAGLPRLPGPAPAGKVKGIMRLKFDFEKNELAEVPQYFLRFMGKGHQIITGLAFGPDGLYFVPMLPNAEGRSFILKIAPDEDGSYPYTLKPEMNPVALMKRYGCLGCHSLNEHGGKEAPVLDRIPLIEHIQQRLTSQAYLDLVHKLDSLETEPYLSTRQARREVLEAQGIEKVHTWIKHHIMQPKFDNPKSQMPFFGIPEEQAVIIADFLLGTHEEKTDLKSRIAALLRLPRPLRYRHMVLAFGSGLLFGLALFVLPRMRKKMRS